MVLEEVGATIALRVLKAPVESKYDWVTLEESMIFKMFGVPNPVVPLRLIETTPSDVGATVFAAVDPGTLTKKSELVISDEEIVANAGAAPVVAFKYCPVVPLLTEERVSADEV